MTLRIHTTSFYQWGVWSKCFTCKRRPKSQLTLQKFFVLPTSISSLLDLVWANCSPSMNCSLVQSCNDANYMLKVRYAAGCHLHVVGTGTCDGLPLFKVLPCRLWRRKGLLWDLCVPFRSSWRGMVGATVLLRYLLQTCCRQVSSVLWSTLWKAAERSSSMSIEIWPLSIATKKTSFSAMSAASLLCLGLKPNCVASRMLEYVIYCWNLIVTTFLIFI